SVGVIASDESMTREETLSLIGAANLRSISADYLKSLLRPCISIKTQRVSETIVGSTKMGGLPDLPQGMGWPLVAGEPLSFVGQFRLSDVMKFDESEMLPPAGMLYFFYDVDPLRGQHQVIYHPV